MAEIFVVNKSASLVGQYVSDLPVVNATPVSRQIGFYLSGVMSGTIASAFLAGADCTAGDGTANTLLSDIVIAGAGNIASSVTGRNVAYSAGESALDFVANYLADILDAGASLETFEVSIEADMLGLADANGGLTVIDIFKGLADLEGLVRAMSGASYESDYSYTETGVVGNHRLIGGKRRIYLRDRVEASLGEGFLRTFTDSGDLVIYLADGSTL